MWRQSACSGALLLSSSALAGGTCAETATGSLDELLRCLEETHAADMRRLAQESAELRKEVRRLESRIEAIASQRLASGEPVPQARTQQPLKPTTPQPDPPIQVGEKPAEDGISPGRELFATIGGILTPKGTLFGETSTNYTTSSDNRFFFSGVEIVDALIIGAIEARDTDRQSVSVGQTVRYGVTGRLEVDVTVPYVAQFERVANVAIQSPTDSIQDRRGDGLGDVSFGLHYQLNRGSRMPYMVANIRAKAPTGVGIFEVEDDEAATGSGYWTVEPSLTLMKRTDPVVLFGNIGYQVNLATNIDVETTTETRTDEDPLLPPILTTTETRFIDFDAGDAIRTSFGIGIALNERVNLNFGYDQSYILASQTNTVTRRVNAQDGRPDEREGPFFEEREGQETTIGSFLFGVSYRPADIFRLGVTTSVGATDEAPDVNLGLRAQYKF